MARPSKYSEKIAEEILSRFGAGESITTISNSKGMPGRTTIFRWRSDYPEFGKAYLIAQELYTDALIDEAGEIVDTECNPQLAKVRSEFRRWLASKLNRSKYGDKIDVQHSHTLDITSIISKALERLSNIGVGTVIDVTSKQLVEAENSDPDAM